MTPRTPIDPELRVLLEEIASDPKAKLFRTEVPRPERLMLAGVEPLGPAATGLTSAEHHLLRVWRDDVAKLLRDAAEWKLQQDPLGAAQVIEHTTAHDCEPTVPQGHLLVELERHRHELEDPRVLRHARLGRALLGSPDARAHQLAGLSLRLTPHDTAWIHVGRALILEGKLAPAVEVLAEVVRRGQGTEMRACALTWIGTAYGCGQFSAHAARAHAAAAHFGTPGPTALMGWFAEALSAGDLNLSREAAEQLDSSLAPDAPGTVEWVQKLGRRRCLDPSLRPCAATQQAMKTLGGRVGPTAQMVIDALE